MVKYRRLQKKRNQQATALKRLNRAHRELLAENARLAKLLTRVVNSNRGI